MYFGGKQTLGLFYAFTSSMIFIVQFRPAFPFFFGGGGGGGCGCCPCAPPPVCQTSCPVCAPPPIPPPPPSLGSGGCGGGAISSGGCGASIPTGGSVGCASSPIVLPSSSVGIGQSQGYVQAPQQSSHQSYVLAPAPVSSGGGGGGNNYAISPQQGGGGGNSYISQPQSSNEGGNSNSYPAPHSSAQAPQPQVGTQTYVSPSSANDYSSPSGYQQDATKALVSPDLYEDKIPDIDDYEVTITTASPLFTANGKLSTSIPNTSIDGRRTTILPNLAKKSDILTDDYSDSSFKKKIWGVQQAPDLESTGDPKCSSETLRLIMHENIVSSPTISKQLIFSAGRLAFGQSIDVVCSKNKFSYTVVSSKVFCEASRGRITCFAFLQP